MPCENNNSCDATIIGAGLSGLLLANALADAGDRSIELYDKGAPRPNHIWGYWDAGETYLETPRRLARGTWQNWQIVSPAGCATLKGHRSSYRAIASADYEAQLKAQIDASVTSIKRALSGQDAAQTDLPLYDTAHYDAPQDCLLQHFGGIEVTADSDCFDPDTAILMDFRVTQSNGIHFIYLLPFSERHALVESTMFSRTVQQQDWYAAQINAYLTTHYRYVNFTQTAREHGVIPMAQLRHSGAGMGVGLAGGALRASSGYAFFQIHRQIDTLAQTGRLRPGTSRLERWMDQVFLRVLTRFPARAPDIFLAMAQHLQGDDFAAFMNGQARLTTLLRVIMAVPKTPFLRSVL